MAVGSANKRITAIAVNQIDLSLKRLAKRKLKVVQQAVQFIEQGDLMMSNSFIFCKHIAADPTRSSFADRSWDNAQEITAAPIFDRFLRGARRLMVTGLDEQKNTVSLNLEIEFDPEADFTYFTSKTSIHDGTLLFVHECIDKCAMTVISGSTYDIRNSAPKNGDTIHYKVGNFILLSEYDMDGTKFAPPDKQWLHERTTVLLPIVMKIEGEK